ncbi:DNA double-strand break repair Rad50 ATPase [Vibrio phage Aphrodite1]|uniref:DNA double-strand break repair Rad50 ATPase n=1 Tax=Vibrio phage Aphrodite1 TaxID=2070057 RepID=A0A2I7QHQ0_9CAUD|nr:DNA double-strand break repair Rad50 ATPase [Vibrio phage Aphrodite1]AUR80921.1 DNA double-strand break repair Rad50 ATPase [Vibrio phage Aphrodite1]
MITELRLKNNTGLLTKGTRSVELTLTDLVNIFMGRNGYGKTSLLKECHPLPPDNADYAKGGYKYVKWVVSEQEFYIMESHTGSSSTHSFKKNGVEELNTGGTLTVQKELCKQYFGLTPNLVKYMSGLKVNDLFTTLSTAVRKQIIMDMYPNDTRYAVNVYNKIKSELRNCVGAIKNQHHRLAEENQRKEQLMGKKVPELEQDIEKLDTRIKEAMVLSGALDGVNPPNENLQQEMRRFIKLTKELVVGSVTTVQTPRELELTCTQYKRIMTAKNLKIGIYRSKITDLMETLSGVNYVTETPEVLEQQRQDLLALQKHDIEVFEDSKRIVEEVFGEVKDDVIDLLSRASGQLVSVLEQVTLASSDKVTLLDYRLWEERLEEINNQGRNLKYQTEELRHQLKHFDMTEDMQCPECDHEFKPGFDLKDVELKRKELTRLEQTLQTVRDQRESLKKRLALDEEFYTTLSKVVSTARYLDDDDRTLLNILKDHRVGYRDATPLINGIKMAVVYRERRDLLNQHQAEIQSLTIRIDALRRNDISELSRQLTELESLLASEMESLRRFNDKLSKVEYKLEEMQTRDAKIDLLETLRDHILESFKDKGRYILKQATSNAINDWVPTKDRYMQMLIRGRSTESVIRSIEEDIQRLEERRDKLQLLQDTICPNKGMIAKLMEDFIKALVGNMNAIIREVFTTPLYILPCVNNKGELSYRFPVINSVDGKPSKDVSDCSGGEQDIINLAFRMVLMRYQSQNRFPLILDEVGVKLDAFHQQRLFDYILNISTNGSVAQILMVSHFFSHTSMFKDPNVIALNSEGISVPEDANRKAKFK